MIKVYTSYFFFFFFMRADYLFLSIALSDPKWYTRNGSWYLDKRGVINGLRAEPFVPRLDLPAADNCRGREGCKFYEIPWEYCPFLTAYQEMLNKLDPKEIEQRFISLGNKYKEYINKPDLEPSYILLVHEAPTNPCSERVMLQKWLKENDFGGKEWEKTSIQ